MGMLGRLWPYRLAGPSSLSAAFVRWLGWQQRPKQALLRRSLSSRPAAAAAAFHDLFDSPALQRFLERHESSRPELAARVRLLRGKEQELRDTTRLAREGETRPIEVAARCGSSIGPSSPWQRSRRLHYPGGLPAPPPDLPVQCLTGLQLLFNTVGSQLMVSGGEASFLSKHVYSEVGPLGFIRKPWCFMID